MVRALCVLLQTAAVSPGPTRIDVHIQPDTSGKILQIVLSIAVAVLSVTTFVIGYRKRIRERRASWYQKIVVDECIPKLFSFFKDIEAELSTAAGACLRAEGQSRKTLSNKVTYAISDFSSKLIETQNSITDRLIVFDEGTAATVIIEMEQLQDNVAKWFQDLTIKKRRNQEEIRAILLTAQRNVVRLLYDCEFKNF